MNRCARLRFASRLSPTQLVRDLAAPLTDLPEQLVLALERAGTRSKRLLSLVAALVMLVFTVWVSVETWAFADYSRELGARSEQVGLLLWPWMAIMPATMLLTALISAVRGWQSFQDLRRGTDSAPDKLIGDRL